MSFPELPQIEREYEAGRRIGFALNIIFSLLAAILLVLFMPGGAKLELEGYHALIIPVFIFSLAICFIARIVLGRLWSHIRRRINYSRYNRNLMLMAMLVFYMLLFCPALWGMITYALTQNLPALLALTAISAAAFFFVTPSLRDLISR